MRSSGGVAVTRMVDIGICSGVNACATMSRIVMLGFNRVAVGAPIEVLDTTWTVYHIIAACAMACDVRCNASTL